MRNFDRPHRSLLQSKLIGHAPRIEAEPGRGEVAAEVADHMHGRGLGTVLIERVAALAEESGIGELFAALMPDNRAMLEVFRDALVVVFGGHRDTPRRRRRF